jgi:hypothetical protein
MVLRRSNWLILEQKGFARHFSSQPQCSCSFDVGALVFFFFDNLDDEASRCDYIVDLLISSIMNSAVGTLHVGGNVVIGVDCAA